MITTTNDVMQMILFPEGEENKMSSPGYCINLRANVFTIPSFFDLTSMNINPLFQYIVIVQDYENILSIILLYSRHLSRYFLL